MIYVSSACFENTNIARIIQQFAEHGISSIELSGGTDFYEGIEQDLIRLKELYRLTYACHAYFPPPRVPFVVNLASCNDRIYEQSLEHYRNCIEMLKRIRCGVLSVHAGFLVEIGVDEIGKRLNDSIVYDEDRAYDRFCSAYEEINRLCSANGIALYLENNVLSRENYEAFGKHDYMMMTDHASIMKMKKQMDFQLLLDLGHLHVSSHTLGLEYERECALLKEDVRWIHVSENNGAVDEHKPLRKGSSIMQTFSGMYRPDINVTLETAGDIREIIESMELIENYTTEGSDHANESR